MSRRLIILFFYILKSSLHHVIGKPDGFTLTLVHPESPESPFFQSNLTDDERFRKRIQQSNARARYLSNTYQDHIKTKVIHPKVVPEFGHYMVKIGIGTFKSQKSYSSYYLLMDTSSSVLWLQCEGCKAPPHHCFPMKQAPFTNDRSISYKPLRCNKHSLCLPDHCIGDSCSYNMKYGNGAQTVGIFANERFTFKSNNGQKEVIKELVFGCSIDNQGMDFSGGSDSQVAGIMGLGWGTNHSIIAQAPSHTFGKFSYCLPVDNEFTREYPISYLRFGTDIASRSNLRATPLIKNNHGQDYYVNLQGLSVNNKRLNISHQYFTLKSDGSGGCVIDTGTSISRIISPAYTILKQELKNYFSNLHDFILAEGLYEFDLCYRRKKQIGFKNFPSVTFHFENVDLIVKEEGLFLPHDEVFCLSMLPYDDVSILGSTQQTNHRFVYDIHRKIVMIGPEDCNMNP